MIDDELDEAIMGIDLAVPSTGPVGPPNPVTVTVSPNGPWAFSLPTGAYAVPNMWSQLNFNFTGKEEEETPELKVEPKVKIENPVCSDCKLVYPYAEVYKGDTFICKGCQLLLDTWT